MELVKFDKEGTYPRISASHIDESIELTPAEQEIKARLRHIHALRMTNKYSKYQAIQIHMREMKVSQATAYRDYNWAMQIFGELDKVECYWQLYLKALKKGDLEQERKALDSYKSLFNFDKEEKEINFEKISAHEYHIKMSRKGMRMLREAIGTGVVDFNELPAEEIDYEESEE